MIAASLRARGTAGMLTALVLATGLPGCASQPENVDLPDLPLIEAQRAADPAEALTVAEIEYEGIRGGRIAAEMPAGTARLRDALLDFEHADGHRSWAPRMTLVSREGNRTVAQWQFEGRMGINPTTEIEFEVDDESPVTIIRFEQRESVFGLGAFFGDYRIRALNGSENRSLLVMRVYIDSGLPFVNASAEDIAAGLREDVRLLRAWLQEQSTSASPTPHTRPRVPQAGP